MGFEGSNPSVSATCPLMTVQSDIVFAQLACPNGVRQRDTLCLGTPMLAADVPKPCQ